MSPKGTSVADTRKIRVRVPRKLHPTSDLAVEVSTPDERCGDCARDCCCTNFLIQNHSNFKRSGPPSRLMYYQDGRWTDFSSEAFGRLRSGFLEGKPVMEVEIEGTPFLFDFHRMLQIDFGTGCQRSVAWIDVHGKCFFPGTFVDGSREFTESLGSRKVDAVANTTDHAASESPEIVINIRIGEDLSSRKRKRVTREDDCEEGEEDQTSSSSNENDCGSKKRRFLPHVSESPRWPKAKLLKEGEKSYSIVKDLFLSELRKVEPDATVIAIHQYVRSGPLDVARHEVFQKQLEITKAARGDANMTFAWHGTSAEGVASILAHGFGMPTKVSGSEEHGVGVYLSPVRSPHMSAVLSEADNNGEKHVILCRVILGRCEEVKAGSRQQYPSSEDFDTGVDDLKNPKWYVVWCANMCSHILPECVVSYKSSDCGTGRLWGSSTVKLVPDASNALIAKLFSKLWTSLPRSKLQDFQTLYGTYKEGKLAKNSFMKQLRSIVGDEMLRSTIREVHG